MTPEQKKNNLRPGPDPGVGRGGCSSSASWPRARCSASEPACAPHRRHRAPAPAQRQPPHGRQAGRRGRADVRLRLCAGADVPRDLRGAGHQRAVAVGARVPRQRARPTREHAGRHSAAPSRSSSTPTRAAPGISSRRRRSLQVHPGRTGHGDVRVPATRRTARMAAQAIPSYAPHAGHGALQQARVLLLQRVHAGAGRDASSGRWCSSSTRSCPRT